MAKKLWIEQYGAVEYAETHTDNGNTWEDKTSDAASWDKYGEKVMDYLFYRHEIEKILIPKANPNYPTIDFTGWATNLTSEERDIMARYVLAPYTLRLTIFSDAEDKYNWFELLRITQGTDNKSVFTGRALLIESMRKHVADYVRRELLTMVQSQMFFKDVFELLNWYIHSAAPDFKLWLYGLDPYENQFTSKDYYSLNMKNELINIYENGGY